jgi:hypothetical protein
MRLRDAPIGSRVFLQLRKQDYAMPSDNDLDCNIVATVISYEDNGTSRTKPYVRIAFSQDERRTPVSIPTTPDNQKVYPHLSEREFIKADTECQLAFNRRFLR